MEKPLTPSEMAKRRWSKTSKKDRVAHANKMVEARRAKAAEVKKAAEAG